MARVTAVTVIVPARDAADTLPACLDALAAQSIEEPFEVLVVDDGSSDGTPELAERSALAPRVVRLPGGGGPGAARAAGAALASGDALAFTDADCVPAPGWLAAGLAALRDADLVQGRTLPPPGTRVGPWDRHLAVTAEWGLYESANLFVRRDLYERIGGFGPGIEGPPESFRLGGRSGATSPKHLGEDVIFGWTARRAGARTAFSDDALVYHAVFPRRAAEYLAERRRVRHFPALAREVPELRDVFFWRRWFLARRSAEFDLALVGVVAAAATRSPLPLAAALPYAAELARDLRQWRNPRVPVVRLAADAVQFAGLLRGSLHARTPLL
jgi:glycosyltransferase involved in cell wall biosynthesis